MKRALFAFVVIASLAACREKVRVRVTQGVVDSGLVATSTVPSETR